MDLYKERDTPEQKMARTWYGCLIDIYDETSELFSEGFVGDGNRRDAEALSGEIEKSRARLLKKKYKPPAEDKPSKPSGMANKVVEIINAEELYEKTCGICHPIQQGPLAISS